jgi:two-component system chemotaxis response regulator CheY
MIKTILTVDDSRTMRDMLRLSLEGAGFRVVQAEDGLHGLEVLACAGTIRGVRHRFWC